MDLMPTGVSGWQRHVRLLVACCDPIYPATEKDDAHYRPDDPDDYLIPIHLRAGCAGGIVIAGPGKNCMRPAAERGGVYANKVGSIPDQITIFAVNSISPTTVGVSYELGFHLIAVR